MDLIMIVGIEFIVIAVIIFIMSILYHNVKVNKVTEEVLEEYTGLE